MSIESSGLKGDLAPKPPEESKLRGSLANKVDKAPDSKLCGTLIEAAKAGEEAAPEPVKFSTEWLARHIFLFKGEKFAAKVENQPRRGDVVILKGEKGTTTNFNISQFIERLESGKWEVAE